MGGCRCVYRRCENSTSVSPGLHYFHFPVRDPVRCQQWIKNAHKPEYMELDKDKLRNKVVCSKHFEEKCFTNIKHDRLIHNAVPTLGFEEDLCPNDIERSENQPHFNQNVVDDIMLIPIDEENTKFALPNVDFAGMSYTIFDDAVIPTSKIEDVIIRELQNPMIKLSKDQQIKSVVKQIKTNLPPLRKKPAHLIEQNREPIFEISNNATSYSVSTLNGQLNVEPTETKPVTHILPDLMENEELLDVGPEIIPIREDPPNFPEDAYTVSVELLNQGQSVEEHHEQIISDRQQMETNEYEAEREIQQPPNSENRVVKQVKKNTKQIQLLKKAVKRQNRFHRLLWQRKQMPHFKKKFDRRGVLETLKDHIKPSLLAILKLELLPPEDIVLNDKEEKFITDLYTKHPECYDLLRSKFDWNLPFSENHEKS